MTDLDLMKEQAVCVRRLADQHEAILGISELAGLSSIHRQFAESAILLARLNADTLDGIVRVLLRAHAEYGDPQPPPRPRLHVVK